MPPYHTFVGNVLTIFLELVADTDCGLGNVTDNILAQLASQWGPIAAANGLVLNVALSAATPPLMGPPPAGITVTTGATPPASVSFFQFRVGRGVNAVPGTRSARISYVTYQAATGYIYEMPLAVPTMVPDVSHELGHVLGLADRYYEALYWLKNQAIDRTCRQIRQGQFGPPEYRDGVADNGPAFSQQPRLAVRAPLPMSAAMVPGDGQYNPQNNLMSNGATALTAAQIATIALATAEPLYRTRNWLAILGDWQRYAAAPTSIPAGASGASLDFPAPGGNFNDVSKWRYPAWEAQPQDGGSGLLFLPPGHNTPHRYACLSGSRRGKAADGAVVHVTRIAAARGRTRVFAFGGTTYNVIGMNVVHPAWMCHTRRMIRDLG